MKICIVSDQHLSANPRVWKEADLLASNGYSVVIVTRFNSKAHKERDEEILKRLHPNIEYKAAVNTIVSEIGFVKKALYKLRHEEALLLKKMGVETKYLVSTDPDAIYAAAKKEQADLYIAHVECGFYAGRKLAQSGERVIFDFEDWHSEDYLVPTRPVKYLSQLENFAINEGIASYCPSESMAKALTERYNANKQPEVIYNGFPQAEFIEAPENKKPVLVWFSQTVGAGRGLEKFLAALKDVKEPVVLRIVGNCNDEYKKTLESLFPYEQQHELELLKPVKHDELHSLLSSCDVGLALESNYPQSRNTTITNKILQYMQAGLKILATDTLGQQEVAERVGNAIKVMPNNNVDLWSKAITDVLSTEVDRKGTVALYNKIYSFEAQHQKLLDIVKCALEK